MSDLTLRQAEVLAFIESGCAAGKPPTYGEICHRFGFISQNGKRQYKAAFDVVVALEALGRVCRMTSGPRALVVLAPLTADEVMRVTGPLRARCDALEVASAHRIGLHACDQTRVA